MYRIKNWRKFFEKSDHKNCKTMPWVAVPTKHDGKGYRKLMRHGPQFYAAWINMLQIAAKAPTRGYLVDHDGPLSFDDMEIKTDCPANVFEEALNFCIKIGWIEEINGVESDEDKPDSESIPTTIGQTPDAVGQIPTTRQDRTRHDKTQHDKTEQDRTVVVNRFQKLCSLFVVHVGLDKFESDNLIKSARKRSKRFSDDSDEAYLHLLALGLQAKNGKKVKSVPAYVMGLMAKSVQPDAACMNQAIECWRE